jgi:hypothetical protein
MGMDKAAVTEFISREVAPMLIDCAARINADLDEREGALPILLYDHTEHDLIRMRRAKLAKAIGKLQIDRVVQAILRHVEEW